MNFFYIYFISHLKNSPYAKSYLPHILAIIYFLNSLLIFSIPVAIIVMLRLNNPEPSGNQVLKKYLISAWKILRTRQAVTYFIASFATFVILFGSYLVYFPFLLEKLFNSSPFIIGIMMSCMSIVTAITSSQLGKISGIFRIKNLLKISPNLLWQSEEKIYHHPLAEHFANLDRS